MARESGTWPPYFVVTSPSAYRAAASHLTRAPEGWEAARLLDWGHLKGIADIVPSGVELVVGLGGGVALDAAKFVALKRGLPVVLAPTIVSSGAIIHGVVARWEGHKTLGSSDAWPWIDARDILVDYDIVLSAPGYLNTAGLGDVLCEYAGIAEWRRNARLGTGPPLEEPVLDATVERLSGIAAGYPKTLASDGGLTSESARYILTAVQQRDDSILKHPAAPMAEHPFWLGAEEVNDKAWIHGELVALGALVIAWYCGESPETLAGWLDSCQVRRRPSEIGISKAELLKAVQYAPRFMSDEANGRDIRSILRLEPMPEARFDELWDYLEAG
jgi:glycerol-1-phosphate dehydrogenase [NAD(P)+]